MMTKIDRARNLERGVTVVAHFGNNGLVDRDLFVGMKREKLIIAILL